MIQCILMQGNASGIRFENTASRFVFQATDGIFLPLRKVTLALMQTETPHFFKLLVPQSGLWSAFISCPRVFKLAGNTAMQTVSIWALPFLWKQISDHCCDLYTTESTFSEQKICTLAAKVSVASFALTGLWLNISKRRTHTHSLIEPIPGYVGPRTVWVTLSSWWSSSSPSTWGETLVTKFNPAKGSTCEWICQCLQSCNGSRLHA